MQSQGRPEKHQLSYKIATEHNGHLLSNFSHMPCRMKSQKFGCLEMHEIYFFFSQNDM